jgi:hypothetical protein
MKKNGQTVADKQNQIRGKNKIENYSYQKKNKGVMVKISLLCIFFLFLSSILLCKTITGNNNPESTIVAGNWLLVKTAEGKEVIVGNKILMDTIDPFYQTDSNTLYCFYSNTFKLFIGYDLTIAERSCYTVKKYSYSMNGDTLLCDDIYEPNFNLPGSTSEKIVKTIQTYGDTLKFTYKHNIQFPDSIVQIYSIGLMVRYAGEVPPPYWPKNECH